MKIENNHFHQIDFNSDKHQGLKIMNFNFHLVNIRNVKINHANM